jgi:hypothetical protein
MTQEEEIEKIRAGMARRNIVRIPYSRLADALKIDGKVLDVMDRSLDIRRQYPSSQADEPYFEIVVEGPKCRRGYPGEPIEVVEIDAFLARETVKT